jgi:hypothetical protein
MSEWRFQYQKDKTEYPIEIRKLKQVIPMTSDQYISKYDNDAMFDKELTQMKESARVSINKKAEINDYTNKLRELARIL